MGARGVDTVRVIVFLIVSLAGGGFDVFVLFVGCFGARASVAVSS